VADAETLPRAPERGADAVVAFLTDRGVEPIEWSGWALLDAYERELGAPHGRERIKVVPREDMLAVMRKLPAQP
jgi:ferredoxin--NADP+ reductase